MELLIHLPLPPEVEKAIASDTDDVHADAREAYAVDLFRRKLLTHHQLSAALGLDRFETDGVLKRHGVMIDFSPEEFVRELADARKLIHK